MITECVCEVEGCGERARFSHSVLPAGWSFLVTFEKPKLPKTGMRQFPVELDDMVLHQSHMPRVRKRAICGKHELPKLVIYDDADDDAGVLLGGMP
jgi:hypothetical protein